MHAINYITPIESMRGSLSASRVKSYDSQGAKAWSMPDGVNTAVNYDPIMVAQKRRDSGHRYYLVRAKSSTNWNGNTRQNSAVFAGACATYSAVLANPALLAQLVAVNLAIAPRTPQRAFLMPYLCGMMRNKEQSVTIASDNASITIDNAWVKSAPINVQLPSALISKFAQYLS